jgi:hypothetical protein
VQAASFSFKQLKQLQAELMQTTCFNHQQHRVGKAWDNSRKYNVVVM